MSYVNRRCLPGPALVLWVLAAMMWYPQVAFAQDKEVEVAIPRYDLGDNTLSIRLGVGLPLFLLATADVPAPGGGSRVLAPNLTLIGSAALNWNAYLDESFTIGAEIGGALAQDINEALLYMVPILARGGYVISTPQMEIPLMLGLGAVVQRLSSKTSVAFVLQPGASFLWRVTADWSFGVTAEYWFTWEPPWPPDPYGTHLFGNFVTATATAVYHF